MAEDKLRRLNNLLSAAYSMIDELADSGDLRRGDGDLFSDCAALIIALHEMGSKEYAFDPELVKEAYQFALDNDWYEDKTGFPVDNPFKEESK